ncbi:MAG: hypothetical protein ACHQAY_06805 [Hyphomicrobiales bacterium]
MSNFEPPRAPAGWIDLFEAMRAIVRVTEEDGERLALQMQFVGWAVFTEPDDPDPDPNRRPWASTHPPDWEELKAKATAAQLRADKLLKRLLIPGKISGMGLDSDGQRKPISEEQWGTLRIDTGSSELCTPGWHTAAEFPPVKAVSIRASDLRDAVLEILRNTQQSTITATPRMARPPKARTGPKPVIMERVKAEMRDWVAKGGVPLDGMKLVEMEIEFRASADTCKRARDAVSGVDI